MPSPIKGLVAAVHTPFDASAALALDAVEAQAEHLAGAGVAGVLVAGTTGEWTALTTEERRVLARRWVDVGHGHGLSVMVHVGGGSPSEARTLAEAAERDGADALATLPPTFLRPANAGEVVDFLAVVAERAPRTPLYFYDIPELSGVRVATELVLADGAARVATLAGVKFTNPDIATLQRCLAIEGMDVLYGNDECLLAALALGVRGAIGSTYNFAAALGRGVLAAFDDGELERARALQRRCVELVDALAAHGYLPAAKALMTRLGVDVGPPRPPLRAVAPAALDEILPLLDVGEACTPHS